MSSARDRLLQVYALASGNDPEAYAWLMAFHGWAHAIDDFVDEPGAYSAQVVDLCGAAIPLFSCGFYRRHAEALGPALAVVAAKYRASLDASRPLVDVLRLAGNDVVLTVAYLRGGQDLVANVGRLLWPIVAETQLDVRHERITQDRAAA